MCNGSMTVGETNDPILHIECKNIKGGVTTKVVEKVVARMRVDFKVSFLFVSRLNGLWSDSKGMENFFIDLCLDINKLYILVVSTAQLPTWLESSFKPSHNNGNGHLLVVFEVGAVS